MNPKHSLSQKITLVAIYSVIAMGVIHILVHYHLLHNQGLEAVQKEMRKLLETAQHIQSSTEELHLQGLFQKEKMIDELKSLSDYKKSSLYKTLPLNLSQTTVQALAEKEGFQLRFLMIPQPQNPEKLSLSEKKIIDFFQNNTATEFFEINTETDKIIYARPVYITSQDLDYEGDPQLSPTGDGKNIFGQSMSNLKINDLYGFLTVTASTQKLHSQIVEGLKEITLLSLFSVFFVGTIFYFLNKKIIVTPLSQVTYAINSSSEQTRGASAEISKSSQQLAEGASKQASALEETSASLEQLTSMTQVNTQHAQNAKNLSDEVTLRVQEGFFEMGEMIKAMESIQGSSEQIAKIIKSIDEIAFQTNILALNAAVEAARAGEAGAGFAVVADEVRNLAQRSAIAARETADRIEESVQRSDLGVEICHRVASHFEEILKKIQKVNQTTNEIANACHEQSLGITEINNAVTSIDHTTQENAASSEELAASAHELSSQAEALSESIHGLAQLIGIQMTLNPPSTRTSESSHKRISLQPSLRAHKNTPLPPLESLEFKDFT